MTHFVYFFNEGFRYFLTFSSCIFRMSNIKAHLLSYQEENLLLTILKRQDLKKNRNHRSTMSLLLVLHLLYSTMMSIYTNILWLWLYDRIRILRGKTSKIDLKFYYSHNVMLLSRRFTKNRYSNDLILSLKIFKIIYGAKHIQSLSSCFMEGKSTYQH